MQYARLLCIWNAFGGAAPANKKKKTMTTTTTNRAISHKVLKAIAAKIASAQNIITHIHTFFNGMIQRGAVCCVTVCRQFCECFFAVRSYLFWLFFIFFFFICSLLVCCLSVATALDHSLQYLISPIHPVYLSILYHTMCVRVCVHVHAVNDLCVCVCDVISRICSSMTVSAVLYGVGVFVQHRQKNKSALARHRLHWIPNNYPTIQSSALTSSLLFLSVGLSVFLSFFLFIIHCISYNLSLSPFLFFSLTRSLHFISAVLCIFDSHLLTTFSNSIPMTYLCYSRLAHCVSSNWRLTGSHCLRIANQIKFTKRGTTH